MKKKMTAGILIGILCLAQLALGGFSRSAAAVATNENPDLQAVVNGNSQFAMELHRKISESAADKNMFYSPFSISTALAMTYAGARGNTAQQMAATMHFDLPASNLHAAFGDLTAALTAHNQGYRLEVANALWGQQGFTFQPEFLTLVQKYYHGGFNTVDFAEATEASRATINRWVEQNTNDKIKNLIPQGALTTYTRLVLTNAIYFKGDWATKFKEERTKPAPFHIRADESVETPMMHQYGSFRYADMDGLKVLELPYVGGELSMVVALPSNNLAELESKLDANSVNGWLAKTNEVELDVFLPKFKFEAEYQLKDVLSGMGMTDAFELPPADFSGISGYKDLYITKVIHKAVIEVNEAGSEAAAATAVVVATKSVQFRPEFRADRPFLFFIRHNATGSILFQGRMVNPAAAMVK